LLPKQHLDIRFIINHENEKVHDVSPLGPEEASRHLSLT